MHRKSELEGLSQHWQLWGMGYVWGKLFAAGSYTHGQSGSCSICPLELGAEFAFRVYPAPACQPSSILQPLETWDQTTAELKGYK